MPSTLIPGITANATGDRMIDKEHRGVRIYRGKPVATMNNSAWQQARRETGLPAVRIHELRHTLCLPLTRGRRIGGRSGSPARPRQPFNGGPLRKRRRRSAPQADKFDFESRRNAHGVARCERGAVLISVDKWSRKGHAAAKRATIASRNPLPFLREG